MTTRRLASDPRAGTDPGDLWVLQPIQEVQATRVWRLVEDWLTAVTPGIGPRIAAATYHRWRRDLRVWVHFCATEARTDAPTVATIQAFRDWAAARWSSRHTNNVLTAIRHCYTWAAQQGRASASMSTSVSPLPVPVPDHTANPALADPARIASAIDRVAGDGVRPCRDRAVLWLLASAPIDTIALRRATVGCVDLTAGTARLIVRGHRRADTVVALVPPAVAALRAYLAMRPRLHATSPLFCGTRGAWSTHPISLVTIRQIVRRVAYVGRLADNPTPPVPTTFPLITPEHLQVVAGPRGQLLLRLVACGAQARLALHRLTVERCDLTQGRIATERSWHVLDAATVALLRTWIGQRTTGPVFPSRTGRASSASSLRAEAWRLVRVPASERVPSAKDLKRANLMTLTADLGPSVAARSSGMAPDYLAERLSVSA